MRVKIVIVEDEKILLKVLKEKFEENGFTVKVAVDGEEAIPVIKGFQPDIVLLDIILPKKDGLQILEELKKSPEYQNIPVIMLSNLGEDDKIKTSFALGATDYFIKTQHPVNEVVDRVKNYLLKLK